MCAPVGRASAVCTPEEATSILGGFLDGAKTIAQQAGKVGKTVELITERLAPLVGKLSVAALWVAQIRMIGSGS
jgi:hypothetical protein